MSSDLCVTSRLLYQETAQYKIERTANLSDAKYIKRCRQLTLLQKVMRLTQFVSASRSNKQYMNCKYKGYSPSNFPIWLPKNWCKTFRIYTSSGWSDISSVVQNKRCTRASIYWFYHCHYQAFRKYLLTSCELFYEVLICKCVVTYFLNWWNLRDMNEIPEEVR